MNNKEFFDLAAELEEKCGDWENSKGLSEEALNRVMQRAEEMDREEKALENRKIRRFRLKKRYIVVLAATLVLLMGTGVVGDRAWITDNSDLEREAEITTKVDNEDKESALWEEEVVYQEIAEKLGIAPMWLGYKPEGMVLDSYTVMEGTGWAYLYYLYNEQLICIQMAKDNIEVSSNVQWDGEHLKIEGILNDHGFEENIEAYCVDEKNHNYGANIIYGNGYYNIAGYFESKENFVAILEGIYFKNL